MKQAFTLIELIMAIVIIGVLASVAVPKFSGLSDSSKISSELSTASSIQVSIDACHGEWIINEGSFTCGKDVDGENDLTTQGYPKNSVMGTSDTTPIDRILKNANSGWTRSGTKYYGPASNSSTGTSKCKSAKPCINKYWDYNESAGTFTLIEP
jgi:prepilin-type N-terminal cleavage/methylation domain-containing protein